MNLLALDLGTKTGYAILRGNKVHSGTRNFKQLRLMNDGLKFLHFRRWLIETIKKYDITNVYYEDVKRHLGTCAAHCFGGYLYHMAAACEEFHIPYVGFPVGTIKKSATGKGNATKEEMINAVRSAGFNPVDHNEADSLAILLLALRKNNPNIKESINANKDI